MSDTNACQECPTFLLQLDRPFNASEAVRAVEFLRAGGVNPPAQASVETAGWGSVDNLGSRPDTLQELQVEVLNARRCARGDYFGTKFTENMICAQKVCAPPACDLPFNTLDTCDVSLNSNSCKREVHVLLAVIVFTAFYSNTLE